ncbi:MAG TPA: hypothetical protein VFR90_07660 [Methylibium sp.]|uniref:hypothetical protein n=1 Tax=Methylibium sp. TaxID=2067992 RepID=UPI002DC04621|nr:hypothetical protein [Methylibium sp.]HEU4458983.1 hypothetical protein [Methylibium sp.]
MKSLSSSRSEPRDPSRRRWLVAGGAGALLLAAGGGAAWLWRPGWRDGQLTASGRTVFRAVARAVLEGSLPPEGPAQEAALERHLDRLALTIAGFPAATRAEIAQLLGILSIAPGRRWLAGLAIDWPQASTVAIDQALRGMRFAEQPLKQQAYHALRDLNNAAWYAQPEHWAALGYPGPVAV